RSVAIMISSRFRRLFVISLAVLGVAPLVAQSPQAAAPPALTVHAIWGTREFASDLVSPTWMKDGAAYTTIDADSAGRTDLYRVDAVSGRLVAFVRANNIYVTDLTTGAETALTADGNDDVINGTSDWVYEEELDLRDAFRWSPDGRRIAFWRLDQTAIRPFYLVNADSL